MEHDHCLNRQEGEIIELDYGELEAFILAEHQKDFESFIQKDFPRDFSNYPRDYSRDGYRDLSPRDYTLSREPVKQYSIKEVTAEPLVKNYSDSQPEVSQVKEFSLRYDDLQLAPEPIVKSYSIREVTSEPLVKDYSIRDISQEGGRQGEEDRVGGIVLSSIKTFTLAEIDQLNKELAKGLNSTPFGGKEFTLRDLSAEPLSVRELSVRELSTETLSAARELSLQPLSVRELSTDTVRELSTESLPVSVIRETSEERNRQR